MSNKDLLLNHALRMLNPKGLGVAAQQDLASRSEADIVSYLPRISPLDYKIFLTLHLRYLNDPS